EVVGLVGARPVGYHPVLELTDDDRKAAAAVIPDGDRPLVVLHPGATDARRRWPAERFSAVGDALPADILVTGTGPERELAERIVAGMRRPARALVDALPLGGFAALVSPAAGVISHDTSPGSPAEPVRPATDGRYRLRSLGAARS